MKWNFLNSIINEPLHTLSGGKFLLYKYCRFIILSVKGYVRNNNTYKAASLTFYTVLAIVPLLALIFGIAQIVGMSGIIEKELLVKLPQHSEILSNIIPLANNLLENTKGGVIAGFGLLVLIFTIIKVLWHIDTSINQIWQSHNNRSIALWIRDYAILIIILLLFLLLAGAMQVITTKKLVVMMNNWDGFYNITPTVVSLLKLLPIIATWAFLLFLYLFVPNSHVKFIPAVVAAIIAGTIYEIVEWVYVIFQVGVMGFGPIYGSFAIIPFFLIWVQISWMLILFGAQIGFCYQNIDAFENAKAIKSISSYYFTSLCVWVACIAWQREGLSQVFNEDYLYYQKKIPRLLVKKIINALVDSNIIIIEKKKHKKLYSIDKEFEKMSVMRLYNKIQEIGVNSLKIIDDEQFYHLKQELDAIEMVYTKYKGNVLAKDLL
jgi:membrane protein